MTVVVTDHHEVVFEENNGKKEYILPMADAIVNHKQKDCQYPLKNYVERWWHFSLCVPYLKICM